MNLFGKIHLYIVELNNLETTARKAEEKKFAEDIIWMTSEEIDSIIPQSTF